MSPPQSYSVAAALSHIWHPISYVTTIFHMWHFEIAATAAMESFTLQCVSALGLFHIDHLFHIQHPISHVATLFHMQPPYFTCSHPASHVATLFHMCHSTSHIVTLFHMQPRYFTCSRPISYVAPYFICSTLFHMQHTISHIALAWLVLKSTFKAQGAFENVFPTVFRKFSYIERCISYRSYKYISLKHYQSLR